MIQNNKMRLWAVVGGPALLVVATGAALFANRQSGKYQALTPAEVRHQMGTAELQKVPQADWLRLKDLQKRLAETAPTQALSPQEWVYLKSCIANPNTSMRSAAVFDVFCVSRRNPSFDEAKQVMRSVVAEKGSNAERQEQKGNALIYLKRAGDPEWKELVASVRSEKDLTPDLRQLCDVVETRVGFNSAR